ncbi:DUF6221 family protein [Streptomyces hygroscopicus]|uniref:DUF6221 family protein n=1 Tax=Streptomyces hygroscopicus TaxID=1912 RepID=UPI0036BC1331
MTAQGEDILAWLETAISARERAARSVGWDTIETVDYLWSTKHLLLRRADESLATTELDADLAQHIALNDPESVLRRCAADRKILELHQAVPDHGRYSEPECPADCDRQHSGPPVCMACRDYAGDPLQAPCHTMLALAEGYGWTEGER